MLIDIVSNYDTSTKQHLRGIRKEMISFLDAQHDSKKILTFLSKCALLSIDEKEKKLYLWAPNDFVLSQVKKFFKWALQEAIHKTYNSEYSLELTSYPDLQQWDHELQIPLKKQLSGTVQKKKEITLDPKTKDTLSDYFGILFEKKYTFNNFVIWSNNELAASAAQAIAEKPWEVYNPYFIYWDVGLWKTHLMQAIWNYIISHSKEKVIVYLPCTKFIDKVIHAVRFNKLEQLKRKLEEVDILMIDDIQFLAWKDKTQEIFHNIFNDFYSKWKQIIITSDQSPKALTLLEARLQSRFSLWLVVDIKAPESETRMAILQTKAQRKDLELQERHLEMLAESITSNVREIEGALNILLTKKQLLRRDLEDNDIYDTLSTMWIDDIRSHAQTEGETVTQVHEVPPLSPKSHSYKVGLAHATWIRNTSVSAFEKKLQAISTYYDIELDDILWPSRVKEISFARQCAMYLAKTEFNRSLQKIWNYFGGKNHSSVIYSIRTFEKYLGQHPNMMSILSSF